MDGRDVGVVFEAGDLVVEGGQAVEHRPVDEGPGVSVVPGGVELFGLGVERVELVEEPPFDRGDALLPELPGLVECGLEVLGEAGVLALLPAAVDRRAGGAVCFSHPGFAVTERRGDGSGVGVLVVAGAGAEFVEVLLELATLYVDGGPVRVRVGGHGGAAAVGGGGRAAWCGGWRCGGGRACLRCCLRRVIGERAARCASRTRASRSLNAEATAPVSVFW